ncbi:hypothetical protein BSKO_01558 [Bryopsis sp. KO-2023]|nr:hypothetical protein BSKO_01558 [Bryopsis sp. KO-2023]
MQGALGRHAPHNPATGRLWRGSKSLKSYRGDFAGRPRRGSPVLCKAPASVTDIKDDIASLQKELAFAVLSESYEDAAKLRDEIQGLEDQVPEIVLRRAFKEATEKEDYAECAKLRDRMKELGIPLFPKKPTKSVSEELDMECSSHVVTRNISVKVRSFYAPQMSSPLHRQYVFRYKVEIKNEGEETVQLKTRHWVIENATGHTEEVRGPGVIGEEPILKPGDAFTYTSMCPLSTTRGWMKGEYQMISLSNFSEEFEVEIGRFGLDMSSPPGLG